MVTPSEMLKGDSDVGRDAHAERDADVTADPFRGKLYKAFQGLRGPGFECPRWRWTTSYGGA